MMAPLLIGMGSILILFGVAIIFAIHVRSKRQEASLTNWAAEVKATVDSGEPLRVCSGTKGYTGWIRVPNPDAVLSILNKHDIESLAVVIASKDAKGWKTVFIELEQRRRAGHKVPSEIYQFSPDHYTRLWMEYIIEQILEAERETDADQR